MAASLQRMARENRAGQEWAGVGPRKGRDGQEVAGQGKQGQGRERKGRAGQGRAGEGFIDPGSSTADRCGARVPASKKTTAASGSGWGHHLLQIAPLSWHMNRVELSLDLKCRIAWKGLEPSLA